MKLILIAGVVFGILAGVVYGWLGVRDISGAKAIALIMSNVMNMLTLVVLMAYGLFNIPVFLWKYADNQHNLYLELERAETVRKDYRSAMADFYLVIS